MSAFHYSTVDVCTFRWSLINLAYVQYDDREPGRGCHGCLFQFRKKTKTGYVTGAVYRGIPTSGLETTFPKHMHLDSGSLGVAECGYSLPTRGLGRLWDAISLVRLKEGGFSGSKSLNGKQTISLSPAGPPFLLLFSSPVALTSEDVVGPGRHDAVKLTFLIFMFIPFLLTFVFVLFFMCVLSHPLSWIAEVACL